MRKNIFLGVVKTSLFLLTAAYAGGTNLTHRDGSPGDSLSVSLPARTFYAGSIDISGQRITKGDAADEIGSTSVAVDRNGDAIGLYRWYVSVNGGVRKRIEGVNGATYTPGEEYSSLPGIYTFTRAAMNESEGQWENSAGSYVLKVTELNQQTSANTTTVYYQDFGAGTNNLTFEQLDNSIISD